MAVNTARSLVSACVVTGAADERLASVAPRLKAPGTHHCVVLDDRRAFVGLIQLSDILELSNPGNRILADLVRPISPALVRTTDSAEEVSDLFEKNGLSEAILIDGNGFYAGLITAQSLGEWRVRELHRVEAALREALERERGFARAKDDFLVMLSHKLRTPLNPVMLLASENAGRSDLSETVRMDFQTIATQIGMEARLIDELIEAYGAGRG